MSEAVKPISPADIAQHKAKVIPAAVIEVFNDMIASKFSGGSATIKKDDVVKAIIERMVSDYADEDEGAQRRISAVRTRMYSEGWLNVEEIFRAAGWIVNYDSPGFNENYAATYEFKAKR